MSHKCDACQKHQDNPLSGAYRFACVHCMARLIKSARPSKTLQKGHIAALEHFHKGDWPHLWPKVQELLKD